MAADASARLSTLKRMTTAIGVLAASAILALLTMPAWRDHSAASAELQRDALMQARIFAAQIDASFRAVDATLVAAAVELERRPAATPINPLEMNAKLLSPLRRHRDARALILIGVDGTLVADSEDMAPPAMNLGERGYFRALRDGFARGFRGPVIDGPFIGRSSGQPILAYARGVAGSDGDMAGVLAAVIDPAQLSRRFEALTAAMGGRLQLHYLDGALVMQSPQQGATEVSERIARRLLAAPGGFGADLIDIPGGGMVAAGFARLEDHPLALVVSLPADDALLQAQRALHQKIGLGVAACLLAAGLIFALISQIRRAERAQLTAIRQERRLAAASGALERALNHTRLGLVLFDPDLRVATHNQRFLDLFDLDPEEAPLGAPLSAVLARLRHRLTDGDPKSAVCEPLRALADMTAEAAPVDGVVILPDGRYLQYCTAPLPPGGGVVTFADVTDAHRAAAHLAEAKERAELADQAKTRLLANVSHELRTPLNAIIGFSEGLAGGYFGPVVDAHRDYLEAIVRSGRHLHALIDDLLDVARIESGGLELRLESVGLRAAVEEALTMLSDRAAKSGVALVDAIEMDEPPLDCDRRALRQMLLNLINNAVKFTPSGGSVLVRLERRADGARALAVCDTGVGIPKEAHDLILRPFAQSETLSRRQDQGVGLGLPIVKGLIEAHGGALELDSVAGGGAVVRLVFPPDEVVAATVAARQEPTPTAIV